MLPSAAAASPVWRTASLGWTCGKRREKAAKPGCSSGLGREMSQVISAAPSATLAADGGYTATSRLALRDETCAVPCRVGIQSPLHSIRCSPPVAARCFQALAASSRLKVMTWTVSPVAVVMTVICRLAPSFSRTVQPLSPRMASAPSCRMEAMPSRAYRYSGRLPSRAKKT
ncbi:hypothetical protein D3C76_1412310 [compost metagenome]